MDSTFTNSAQLPDVISATVDEMRRQRLTDGELDTSIRTFLISLKLVSFFHNFFSQNKSFCSMFVMLVLSRKVFNGRRLLFIALIARLLFIA